MKTFQFDTLPKNVEELKKASALDSPHATAALFILAICRYVEDKDSGIAMINYLKGPAELTNYDKQFLRDRFMDKPYLPFSYFKGATPENNYTPKIPYEIDVFDWTYTMEAGYTKVFLQSGGADSQRPIVLRQKGEEHFLWEFNSLLLGIRIPKEEDPWA